MAELEELLPYDDVDSLNFIKNYLPQEQKAKFEDDDIYYIVDLMYEYYDETGAFDGDEDSMVDIDEEAIAEYVVKAAQKDKYKKMSADDILFVVQGEIAYCESIGMFE